MEKITYILTRIIIGTGIALAIFIIKNNVFAASYSSSLGWGSREITQSNQWVSYEIPNAPIWKGFGNDGADNYAIFSFDLSQNIDSSNYFMIVSQVYLAYDNNTSGMCDIGSFSSYVDNHVQRIVYSAKCPISTQTKGINSIQLFAKSITSSTQTLYSSATIQFGGIITGVWPSMSTNSTLEGQTNSLIEQNGTIISQNQQMLEIQQAQNKNIEDIKNYDIDEKIKEKVNTDNQKQAEDNINDVNAILDENKEEINFNIQSDTNANNFIWALLTQIIQTNQLIFTMITSILLIGVIKLALGR